MQINDINRINRMNSYRSQSGVHSKSESGKKSAGNDQVHISEEALRLLDSQDKTQDPARSQRIQELQQSVSTGTYHVDAGKIAEKLAPWLIREKN